jgi:DNA-binding transcriptional LysR family regulator
MLDVRRLRVLREVAACGSFSAAAESLSFTQSAVSQQVAALERECATKLLERGPRGVRLTEAGRALVEHADAILARIEDAEQELAAIAGLRGGRLRLATFQSAGATIVPRALGEFHRRHPEVELIVKLEEEDARGVLQAGEVDIALVMDFPHTPLLAPDLELTPLLEDPYDVILPDDHPLAARTEVALEELADERFVVHPYGMGCREGTVAACRAEGFEPKVAIECDENDQVQAFVGTGLGVGVYPRLALANARPGVAIRPVAGEVPIRRIFAATLAEGYRSPASEAMLGILVDVAGEFAESDRTAVA